MKIEIVANREHADKVLAAIKKNDGYCPCAIEKRPETKCMCKEFREQTVSGLCHCGLYFKTV